MQLSRTFKNKSVLRTCLLRIYSLRYAFEWLKLLYTKKQSPTDTFQIHFYKFGISFQLPRFSVSLLIFNGLVVSLELAVIYVESFPMVQDTLLIVLELWRRRNNRYSRNQGCEVRAKHPSLWRRWVKENTQTCRWSAWSRVKSRFLDLRVSTESRRYSHPNRDPGLPHVASTLPRSVLTPPQSSRPGSTGAAAFTLRRP